MIKTTSLAAIASLCVAFSSPAQSVNNYGLTASSSGNFAGQACNTNGCQTSALSVVPGAAVQFAVWGSPGSFFGLGFSAVPASCTTIPGIANGLLLGAPVETLAIGVLNIPAGFSICLATQESEIVVVNLPRGLTGLRFRVQALTIGGVGGTTSPVFTDAIDVSIQ